MTLIDRIVLDYRGRFTAPHYATMHAAGLDLTAELDEPLALLPGYRALVPTGLWLQMPENTEMQVRPRSGLALKHGITVLNAPGTIDCDYTLQVGVLLINLGQELYTVQPGDKIAQGVFARVLRTVDGFTINTKERAAGFGSTGK
jgi:dUTP pyrophosphatase